MINVVPILKPSCISLAKLGESASLGEVNLICPSALQVSYVVISVGTEGGQNAHPIRSVDDVG